MLTLRIMEWPTDTGLEHVSTTWQISDKNDFLTLIDEKKEDTIFLNVYRSNVIIPIGKEYYGRSKRHFSNGASSDWVGPVKLISNMSGENIDLKPEVVIEEPVINIVDDKVNNTLTLKAGAFRCDNDGHKATNWILKDGIGNILFRSIYDTVNKKEIIIDRVKLNLDNSNIIIAEVSYISTNDFESHFGSSRLELNKFNFEVVSNTNFIPVNEDYEFKFKIINNAEYILSNYIVKDDSGTLIQEGPLAKDETRLIIERSKLKPKTTYKVYIYSEKLPNDVNITTFYTNSNESIYKIDKNYKYNEEYVDTGIRIPEAKLGMIEQFIDNGIPISTNDDKYVKLFHYNKRIESITLSDLNMAFLQKPTTGLDGINVKVINNDKVLVDANTGVNGKSEFIVYDYTYGKVLKSITRTDEVNENYHTNALTVGLHEQVYYFTKVNEIIKFRKYDIATNSISDLTIRPDIVNLNCNLVYIGNDRIMSFGGSNLKHLVYLYDISDDVWYEVNIIPERFRDLRMSSFLRKDGKVISFNTGNNTNDVLVFNPDDNSIEEVINDLDDTIDLDSTIRLRDGEFLRYDSRQDNPVIYRYR